jgi:branched-chain amino acid transport system substrate-binding protein
MRRTLSSRYQSLRLPPARRWAAALGCLLGIALPVSAETLVKIGSVAPLTGPQAHLGRDNDNGVRG